MKASRKIRYNKIPKANKNSYLKQGIKVSSSKMKRNFKFLAKSKKITIMIIIKL